MKLVILLMAASLVSGMAHAGALDADQTGKITASELTIMGNSISNMTAMAERAMAKSQAISEDSLTAPANLIRLHDYLLALRDNSQQILASVDYDDANQIDAAYIKIYANLEKAEEASKDLSLPE